MSDTVFGLLASATALGGLLLFIRLLANAKKRRREQMDDDVDFVEWRFGTPNDPIPDDAVPVKQTGLKD